MANRTFADYAASLSSGTLDSVIGLDGSTVKTGSAGGASYLVYTALLSQTGTSAPVATVLENTLGGTVVWTRDDAGEYTATLSGAFTVNKTWLATPGFDWSSTLKYANIGRTDANSLKLFTTTEDGTTTADEWTALPIEIRVYP